MEAIIEPKICGIDAARPPKILNYPCIFLFFELDIQAPKEWCDEFNRLVSKWQFATRIEPAEGKFIETWVRQTEEIPAILERLKAAVQASTEDYIRKKKIRENVVDDDLPVVFLSDAQKNLNQVIKALKFD